MELIKNIFFNTDKLIENTSVKISYTGNLFQENNEEIYIHYGFGSNWDNVNDVKMQKTELGFQAEINLPETNKLNFCFKNNFNNWDNNLGENYIFDVEKNYEIEFSEPELFKPNITDLTIISPSKLAKTNRLRKSYIWTKKAKLTIYKVFVYFPKLLTGNYKRKIIEN